uniref:Uncharacterized protein n=1 Tax=Anopheles culicifacies TaxID=139723 RepID=A0A182M225_9DIPT
MLVSDASSCKLWERLCRPEPDRDDGPRWPPPTPLSSPFSVPLLVARSVRYWLNISPVGLGRSLLLTTSSNASSFSVCSAPQIICSSSVTCKRSGKTVAVAFCDFCRIGWKLLEEDPNGGVDWAIGSCNSTVSFVPLANDVVFESLRFAVWLADASRSAVTSSLNISQCPKLSRSTDFSSSRLQYISTRPDMALSRSIGAVRSMAGFRSFTCPSSSISCSTVSVESCTFVRSISIGGDVASPLVDLWLLLADLPRPLLPPVPPIVEC